MDNQTITPDAITRHMEVIITAPDPTTANLLVTLEKYVIDTSKELQPPKHVLTFEKEYQSGILGTLGGLTLITGKAKSKKTFCLGMMTAAALNNGYSCNSIKGNFPEDQRQILYFDTEMDEFYSARAIKRIIRLSGNHDHSFIEAYHLRRFTPAERLQMIEAKIYNTPKLGMVIIDGIRDLITSVNDEEQATMISSKLLKWTDDLNIHIAVILHQNKSNTDVRGHSGTELLNKANLVLSVERDQVDDNVTVVRCVASRDVEPEPFAFIINEDGLPEITDIPEKESAKPAINPKNYPDTHHDEILKAIFLIDNKPNGTVLKLRIKESFGFGDTKAREFLEHYISVRKVNFSGKKGSRNGHYELSI